MPSEKRFLIYAKEQGSDRFKIAPVGVFGHVIMLLNMGLFFVGIFNLFEQWSFVSQTVAIVALILALAFWCYSLIFLTDYGIGRDDD